MKPYISYIAFVLFLLIFISLKLEVLNVPLFWDELGVYGKGIFQMIEQGPSLLPAALEPEISRGHPLLFTFIISFLSQLFGSEIIGLRSAVLFISIGTLIGFYLLLHKCFKMNSIYALLGTAFLSFQALFFAQSTMILPELSLSLFVILMLLGYQLNIWVYLIAAVCALLTKESALVFILCFSFFELFFYKKAKNNLTRPLILLLPIIPFIAFLILQKITFGWYFFPYHSSSFEINLISFLEKFKGLFVFLFFSQGRWLSTLILTAIIIFLLTKTIKLKKNLLLVGLLISSYIGFHSFTFNMNRYLLPILPMYTLLIVMSIGKLDSHIKNQKGFKSIGYLTIIGLTFFSCFFWKPTLEINEFNHDDDMTYLNHTEASLEALSLIKKLNLDDSHITMTFPLILAVEDSKYGYSSKDEFKNAQLSLDSLSEYLIQQTPPFINPTNLSDYEQVLIKELTHKNVRTRIFRINKN